MKKESQLNRYKEPEKQLKKINDWVNNNYRMFRFRLHKERDKEIIEAIDNREISMTKLIESWFYKK